MIVSSCVGVSKHIVEFSFQILLLCELHPIIVVAKRRDPFE
jgi:hypothetical protein